MSFYSPNHALTKQNISSCFAKLYQLYPLKVVFSLMFPISIIQ